MSDFVDGDTGSESVGLIRISEPRSVNALVSDDVLTFAARGITLVYGENGSGTSGYARILKKVTRSRHNGDVLSNVFSAPAQQSARLTVCLGEQETELAWPADNPDYMKRVSFYDSDCAARYIFTDTEVVYRPSLIALLDELVGLSSRVRQVLEERRRARTSEVSTLPSPPPTTRAAAFVDTLSAQTVSLDIDLASELPTDVDERLATLRARISNLESGDSGRMLVDLHQLLDALDYAKRHIAEVREMLSDASYLGCE